MDKQRTDLRTDSANRVRQDGVAIRELREQNGYLQSVFAKLMGTHGGFPVDVRTIRRWEAGHNVQSPALVWAALQALREAGKLPRGDLAALGVALGQIEKGSENHQHAEDSRNPLQGTDFSKLSGIPSESERFAILQKHLASPQEDLRRSRSSLNLASQLAYGEPFLTVWERESPRMLLESFLDRLWKVPQRDQVEDLACAIAHIDSEAKKSNARLMRGRVNDDWLARLKSSIDRNWSDQLKSIADRMSFNGQG